MVVCVCVFGGCKCLATQVSLQTCLVLLLLYVKFNSQLDIALIELNGSVNDCTAEENRARECWKILPVRLARPHLALQPGTRVRTLGKIFFQSELFCQFFCCLGWGLTEGGFESDLLRQLDLTLASTDQEFLLETDVGPNGEDPCAGDSGMIAFVTEFGNMLHVTMQVGPCCWRMGTKTGPWWGCCGGVVWTALTSSTTQREHSLLMMQPQSGARFLSRQSGLRR